MLRFFSFVGTLPVLDGIQIISSKLLHTGKYTSHFSVPLSLCYTFPTLPVNSSINKNSKIVRK